MPCLIARRIDTETFNNNDDHARALIAYCARPENEAGQEKCILLQTYGFSDDENGRMTTAEIAEEMAHATTLTPHQRRPLIAHWVISWKGGTPKAGEALDAARMLVADLGYSERTNKMAIAIHADTDHVHAHIAICRVNTLTGQVVREGWYKREAQKSLARIAHKHGWTLAPGARYRVAKDEQMEDCTTPDGKPGKRQRVVEIKTSEPPAMHPRQLRASEERAETRGTWSEQRYLQGALSRFFEAHTPQEMAKWKAADLHKQLARIGVSLEVVSPQKGRHSLVFSCGENKYKAGELLTGLTYRGLMGRIKGDWRDARDNIAPILAEAREKIAAERAAWEQDKARELAQRETQRRERRAARPKTQRTTQTPHKAASRPRPYQRPPKGGQVNAKDDPATALLNSIFGASAPKPAPEPKQPKQPRKEREQPPAQAAQEVGENGRHQLDQSLVDGRGRGRGAAAEVEAIRPGSSDDQRDGRMAGRPSVDQGAQANGDSGRGDRGADPRGEQGKPGGVAQADRGRDQDADRGAVRSGNAGLTRTDGDGNRNLEAQPADHAAHGSNGDREPGRPRGSRETPGAHGNADRARPANPGSLDRERGGSEAKPGDRGAAGAHGGSGAAPRHISPEDGATLERFDALSRRLDRMLDRAEQLEIQNDIDTRHGPAPGYGAGKRQGPQHGPRR